MSMFKISAVAMAVAFVAGSAVAAAPAKFETGNGSLLFVALDNVGTPQSLVVDLGFNFSDFTPGSSVTPPSSFYQPGQTIVWNFINNSVTVNGVSKTGPFNWSGQFAGATGFAGNATAADTRYGVIGGGLFAPGFNSDVFLTTGTPTTGQVTDQLATATSQLGGVDVLYNFSVSATSSFGANGYGANYATGTSETNGSLASSNFGPEGKWQGNLAWSAFSPEGQSNNFYFLNNDFDGATQLAGTFNYANGMLTYATAPVPEPSALMMSLAGMAVLYGVGRRRREDR